MSNNTFSSWGNEKENDKLRTRGDAHRKNKITFDTSKDLAKELISGQSNFSSIRNAIQTTSEGLATQEFLDTPEQRHIDYVISMFKDMKKDTPEMLKKIIIMTAKVKDLKNKWNKLKDELGPKLETIITQILDNELLINMKDDIKNAIMVAQDTKKITDEEVFESEIIKRYLNKKYKILQKDPRIIEAFAGKEELLHKVLEYNLLSLDTILSLKDISE